MRMGSRAGELRASPTYPEHADWDKPGAVDYLKAEYVKGTSSAQIAAGLREHFGVLVTRNAVIGKRNRLGLNGSQLSKVVRDRRAAPVVIQWLKPHDDLIVRMQKAGEGPTAIANRLTRDHNVPADYHKVRSRMITLGVWAAHGDMRAPYTGEFNRPNDRKYENGRPVPKGPTFTELAPETGGVPMQAHTFRTCHWPIGEGVNMHMCGDKLYAGAYCKRHAEIGYTRLPDIKRDANFWCGA